MRMTVGAGVLACTLLAACGQKSPEAASEAPAVAAAEAPAPSVPPPTPAAAAAGTSGEKVQFAGCPVEGVETGCIVVQDGGQSYNVSAARPKIEIRGQGISGEGVISDGVSFCMQGTILKDITYTYTKQKCPLGPEKAPAK